MPILFILALSGCGGSGSSTPGQGDPQVSGNWQFALTSSSSSLAPLASSALQGGFLVQKNGSITGQIEYSIVPQSGGGTTFCNAGAATITGTISGNSVTLTAAFGTLDANGNPATQTLTLNAGSLSANGSAMNGNYTLTAGWMKVNNQLVPCPMAQDTGTWSATLVPPLTGGFQGFFHSTQGPLPSLENQDFPVSGTFTQGPNIGTATTTITGTLLFQDPITLRNDYPCLASASVNGTISGNTVLLQVFSSGGTVVGEIGQPPGAPAVPPFPVTFDPTQGGYVLHNLITSTGGGAGYVISTKSCSNPSDSGNLCLALGGSKACSQPITLTPFALNFAPQLVGSAPTSQTITLTNNSSSQLSGLTLNLTEAPGVIGQFYGLPGEDFNGVPYFTEQDTCSQNGTITLAPSSSCVITVNFSPQESCPWLPQVQNSGVADLTGAPPAVCPLPLTATLTITLPSGSADPDNQFSVPLTGTGLSRIVPSVPEIDFGAEAVGEASPPQTLTFTNQSLGPVVILPPPATPWCTGTAPSPNPPPAEPRPPDSSLGGIQLAEAGPGSPPPYPIAPYLPMAQNNPFPTVGYWCEIDPPRSQGGSGLPNFQIANDGCSGRMLQPFGQSGDSCSLQITFVPQPATWKLAAGYGLDDFVQLNTNWCGDANNPPENDCEVDSGRFPVEVKTNPPSPLRMSPSAGMDFGTVFKGRTTAPLTVTIFNDPVDPMAGAVTFTGKQVTGADYLETDNCPATLATNQSCKVTVTFTPTVAGLDPGNITFTYSTSSGASSQTGLTQTIHLRGTGQ